MAVYFITCREANAVKIGSSHDPHGRLPEIQCGCPLPLKLEAMTPGGHEQEHELHRRFADDRLCGEWFRLNDMIEAMISACGELPPAPSREVRAEKRRIKRTAAWYQSTARRRGIAA